MIQEDFCLDCWKNIDKKVEKGRIIIADLEIEDYHKDGGESIPLKSAEAECFNKSSCVFYEKENYKEINNLLEKIYDLNFAEILGFI